MMNTKREKNENGGIICKRRWLTLGKKLDIIKCHENGASYAKIARENGMNESSVRTIIRKKDQYKEQGVSTSSYMSKVTTKKRSLLVTEMERLLLMWIEDCYQMQIPLNQNIIQGKALNIYNALKENDNNDEEVTETTFTASRGWFSRFKTRVDLYNVKVPRASVSAVNDVTASFPTSFKGIIDEGGYEDQQIFIVSEAELFWKKMPARTFLAENEKSHPTYKAKKDRLTLLLGGNVSGDLKLKPLLMFKAENPRALKGHLKNDLPVIWRSNKKAWITRELFLDWFNNYFCPKVQCYCSDEGIPFKILLILHNTPGLSEDISDLNENVKTCLLPPNTNSLLQPMGQGLIALFKAYYLRRTFSLAINSSIGLGSSALQIFWMNYNIRYAIENISASWFEIDANNMRSVWSNFLHDLKTDFSEFESQLQKIAEDIVKVGKALGFESLDTSSIFDCIDSHITRDLGDSALLDAEMNIKEEDIPGRLENNIVKSENSFSIEDLGKVIEGVNKACQTIVNSDPNVERSFQVCQILQNGISCYKDLYANKISQPV